MVAQYRHSSRPVSLPFQGSTAMPASGRPIGKAGNPPFDDAVERVEQQHHGRCDFSTWGGSRSWSMFVRSARDHVGRKGDELLRTDSWSQAERGELIWIAQAPASHGNSMPNAEVQGRLGSKSSILTRTS